MTRLLAYAALPPSPAGGVGGAPPPGRCPERGAGGRAPPPPSPLDDEPVRPPGARFAPPLNELWPLPRPRLLSREGGGCDPPPPASSAVCPARWPVALPPAYIMPAAAATVPTGPAAFAAAPPAPGAPPLPAAPPPPAGPQPPGADPGPPVFPGPPPPTPRPPVSP